MAFPVALFGLGAWSLASDLVSLGVSLWVLAWLIIGWVIVADIMARRVEYLDAMARAIEASAHTDIVKLSALGFSHNDTPGAVSVELHDKRDGMNSTKYFELPVASVKIIPLARAVLNGQPFTERRWTGAGGLLTTGEFRTLRGVLRDRGMLDLVSDADHRQGYKLNNAGVELFASLLPSPPPLMDIPKNA